MKVPVFYANPYAQLQEAEFSIRFEGTCLKLFCKRLNGHKKRIRVARALLIRGKVITAQENQYWKLNKNRTHWIFYSLSGFWGTPPKWHYYRIASIPSHEVYWALSDSNSVETYERRKITRWKIIRTESFCRVCDAPGLVKPDRWTYICDNCRESLKNLSEERRSTLENPEKFSDIAQQDRSHNSRWLRRGIIYNVTPAL
jgi:hypothetical protein